MRAAFFTAKKKVYISGRGNIKAVTCNAFKGITCFRELFRAFWANVHFYISFIIFYNKIILLYDIFVKQKGNLQFFIEINEEKITEKKSIDEYFDIVKIDKSDRDKLLRDYSHGMKNKMQMLINIISNPKVILLDEPLTSLDIVVQEDMKKLLKSLKKDHIIIFSTHILELAMDLCDEIVILNHKKIEKVEKYNLNTKKYKTKIINCLKDDCND